MSSRSFPLSKSGGPGVGDPNCQDLRLRSAECSILGTSWFELIDRDSIAIPTIDVGHLMIPIGRNRVMEKTQRCHCLKTDTGCLLMGILCLAMFPKDKGFK